ncbi:hypothetical protein ACI6QG_19110 [Roseococcus sp. DSY-14]|uniref:hypothetical protein n=1 Tax=Roseococcus sp. DSY-14 TaxID=3369650 RepID=UPI00387B087B
MTQPAAALGLAALGLDTADPLREALALAALARDCAASGVERRVLHLRLSLLPREQRQPRHLRLLREALAPALRPTRGRLHELPGGDLMVLSPPPGEHLLAARAAVAKLLPEHAAEELLPLLRLPQEAARLLTVVEAALGMDAAPAAAPPPAPRPAPPEAEFAAALRALAGAEIAAHLRRRPSWRLEPGAEAATPAREEVRPDLPALWERLLPGLAATPAQEAAFRHAAQRRMLLTLARPEELRQATAPLLPLALPLLEEDAFLRLEAALGPLGRRSLAVLVPWEEALADPGAWARLRRWAGFRGWTLGLDGVTEAALLSLPLARMGLPLLRLRFAPAWLRHGAAARAALDAALPGDRASLILAGADAPAAIAWGWQRGIAAFEGRLLRG